MTRDILSISSGDASVTIDADAGGRVSSLRFGSAELLWNGPSPNVETETAEQDPLAWGMYPMVPFAGRIRLGRFTFDDVEYALPCTAAPNAMHGYGFTSSWTAIDDATIGWDFAEPWPFAGRATQRFDLSPSTLTIEMTVFASDRQPVMLGWHPWFRRENTSGDIEVEFNPGSMYQRDEDGMPTTLVYPPPGPWDDCFVNVIPSPVVRWGDLAVALESSLDHWVLFDELAHALCIEPQSGPPNEINESPRIVEAGESFTATFTLRRL